MNPTTPKEAVQTKRGIPLTEAHRIHVVLFYFRTFVDYNLLKRLNSTTRSN